MVAFEGKTQEELDRLINIGKKYLNNTVSESLLYDVLKTLGTRPETVEMAKQFLRTQGIEVSSNFSDVEEMYADADRDRNYQIKPFDPSEIEISPKNMSLDRLLDRLEYDEIDLMPGFQRKAGLWTDRQKSQLIESLILRIPLPVFYFDGTDRNKWIVIDGLQRLTALKNFFVDKSLKLTGLEFLNELEGLGCDELPKVYLRRMKETQIICYIINPGAPVNLKYNIFKRINTGGLQLEPQEIRHALYQGFATDFLKKLAESEIFRETTGYSVPSDRMLDREFVLRFIAFYEQGVYAYYGVIDEFLNSAMDLINAFYKQDPSHAADVERRFYDVLCTAGLIFGKYAFRRMPDKTKRRTISKALFETWTTVLAKLPNNDLSLLVIKREDLERRYMNMFLQDEEFSNSIGSGKVSAVRKRFEKIESLVKEVLEND